LGYYWAIAQSINSHPGYLEQGRRYCLSWLGLETGSHGKVGRDVAQDIQESKCESCGDLTNNNTVVNCREWHYRGKVYSAAPLPLLIESIMSVMLNIDMPPVIPSPLEELPENLQRYFNDKKQNERCC
jgi:hypothetical protein